MGNITEIASNISTPIGLAGLFAAIFFLAVKQLLEKDVFSRLTRDHSAEILKIIVDRLFILSLIAMVLGFSGYVVAKFVPSHQESIEEHKKTDLLNNTNRVDIGQSRRYIESILGIPEFEIKNLPMTCDLQQQPYTYLRWGDITTEDPVVQMILDEEDKLILIVVHVGEGARFKPASLKGGIEPKYISDIELGKSSIFDITQMLRHEDASPWVNGDARYFSIVEKKYYGHTGYHNYYNYTFSYSYGDYFENKESNPSDFRKLIIPTIMSISEDELQLECDEKSDLIIATGGLVSVPAGWFEKINDEI